MQGTELREKTTEELEALLKELRAKLVNLKFQLSVGKLTDHTAITKTKRDIARVLTVLRERGIKL
ncbi:MAG TPA: 50S ribosomal protein L29 [Coprothermobacter proteolyticus]|jgi:large subunit ribosomal protein L29|uniref:Large ribosomal subunit protein uL29 n=1 Tax=Coprothermobacter proteolyticus (strain ATCC 35245 / DSM 5265 / OCM 4 / BT) TaxID=309798 RepID=RL29_COPPD|nr:50S ribosomal protein L29 [Coprothermobacter proteolyticus]B5Y980.1 RecName: Full=Large ribosomal subunit protein uL29; AltName: Full=50S ribosomal protein L29 [Coprothermobacter proteolyticus DSM 5265]MBP8983378.1 50S ribosomal protein L29 [Coprothermobacter sp.]ACI17157.1 50S ribosomal protein L29 [Coprothermobacter proteolyticus DSM 5265]NLT83727.1 50S ribosomal protein L29 [Coprothermobacter proteolyticus]HAR39855.1 50S ribosomal protein L29 [Coprothermobacter sp.]HOA65234.1 50S riboso